MADRLDVEVTGKSKYQVAESMATTMLISIEGKSWKNLTRQEYLKAVFEAIQVLNGFEPDA